MTITTPAHERRARLDDVTRCNALAGALWPHERKEGPIRRLPPPRLLNGPRITRGARAGQDRRNAPRHAIFDQPLFLRTLVLGFGLCGLAWAILEIVIDDLYALKDPRNVLGVAGPRHGGGGFLEQRRGDIKPAQNGT
ncbi:MAG: hypothetical protein GY930_18095 [bacterium]|nr:hypothetical protein [bacterium]